MQRICVILMVAALVSCSTGPALNVEEKAKLDPMLQELVLGRVVAEHRYDVGLRPDGSKEYGVIVRTGSPEDVRSLGITIGSVVGEIVTVRVNAEELRRLAALPSVRSIQSSALDTLHK